MSFAPVIPMPGLAGWAFLSRTRDRQEASHAATPAMQNDVAHFRDRFAKISTSDELVANRRVLRVVLGAFGLQDDLDNRAFIRKIIDDGVEDRRALANRLSDKRYAALARDLQHLAKGADTTAPDDLTTRLIDQYRTRSFEQAVGEQDQSMRLAMNLERELPQLAEGYSSDTARWFALLGAPPLRQVMETALGLPKEFGALDIDQQVSRLKAAAGRQFGSNKIEDLAKPDAIAQITKRFLVMSQLKSMNQSLSPAQVALTLLGR